MLSQHRTLFGRSLYVLDLCILGSSPLLARSLRHELDPFGSQCVVLAGILVLAWFVLSIQFEVYRSRRTDSLAREVVVIGEVLILAAGVAAASTLAIYGSLPLSIPLVVMLAAGGLLASRVTLRTLLRFVREKQLNYKRVLFVGRGRTTLHLANSIESNPQFGLRPIGFLTFEGEETSGDTARLKHLGPVREAASLFKTHAIDEVIVCPSLLASTGQIQDVLDVCDTVGVTARLAPDFLAPRVSKPTVAWFGDCPTYTFSSGPQDALRLALKRVIDILGALSGLILLAPALTACAVAIKLTSRGPVLFRQRRSGLRGQTFVLYKFRSMAVDADRGLEGLRARNEQQGPVFKIKNDPRITPVGRFLRRYSLDELPQLLNVLKGDMSLVGPRPPLPAEVERYDLWQRRRLSVKPGLTCIWQVSGRNSIPFQRWMELDMEYIDRWSLRLDLKLIAKTIGVVLKGTGM